MTNNDDPWELVHEIYTADHQTITERMKIPGGWLYKVTDRISSSEKSMQICFVPGRKFGDD